MRRTALPTSETGLAMHPVGAERWECRVSPAGRRVTLFAGHEPVLSVWEPDGAAAWASASTLYVQFSRNRARAVTLERSRRG